MLKPMNNLAKKLNEELEGSCVSDLLSDFGRRFYFPKGIAAQSAEAGKLAELHNATIGMAFEDTEPMMLGSLRSLLPYLTPKEAVAYAPNAGDPELRELWRSEIIKKNPDIGDTRFGIPTVVPGLTNGIAQIADLFVDPGDPIVIPDMFWGNYRLIFEVRKEARIVPFPFYNGTGFNLEGFKKALSSGRDDGKLAVVLNFPNNPTGYSPTVDEANGIVEAIRRSAEDGTKILVVIDDAYFGLFYESDTYLQSLFARLAGVHDNVLAVKVDGATKEEFVWGFRVGFVTFGAKGISESQYRAMEQKLLGAIRSSISNSSRPAQTLIRKAMQSPNYHAEKKAYFDMLKERYSIVRSIVDAAPKDLLDPLPFNSGYFMSFRVKGDHAEDLRTELLHNRKIGTIAIQDTYLRVAYSSIVADKIKPLYREIYEAAERVAK